MIIVIMTRNELQYFQPHFEHCFQIHSVQLYFSSHKEIFLFFFCLLSFVSLSECFNLLLVWSGLLAILSGLAFGSLICTHFIAKFTENLQKPFQFFRFGFINFICHEIFLSIRRRVVLAADFENST